MPRVRRSCTQPADRLWFFPKETLILRSSSFDSLPGYSAPIQARPMRLLSRKTSRPGQKRRPFITNAHRPNLDEMQMAQKDNKSKVVLGKCLWILE